MTDNEHGTVVLRDCEKILHKNTPVTVIKFTKKFRAFIVVRTVEYTALL